MWLSFSTFPSSQLLQILSSLVILSIFLLRFLICDYLQRRSHDFQLWGGGGSFNPDLLNKKGTTCGPFTEKNRPTQEVQHLISSFWAGPRRIWDQNLIFYGPLYSGPFSEGRFCEGPSPPPPPPPQWLRRWLNRSLVIALRWLWFPIFKYGSKV